MFENLQKCLRFLGIYQPKSLQKLNQNRLWNTFYVLLLLSFLFSTLWFFIFEEKSFIDFVKSVCVVIIAILNCFTYSILLLQKSRFFRLFDEITRVIKKREFNLMVRFYWILWKYKISIYTSFAVHCLYNHLGMQNECSIQPYQEMTISIEKWSKGFCVSTCTSCILMSGSGLLFSFWGYFTTENYTFHYALPTS